MTKFEQIKALTLGEMAEFLYEHCGCSCCSRKLYESCLNPDGTSASCRDHILEYLESEGDDLGI